MKVAVIKSFFASLPAYFRGLFRHESFRDGFLHGLSIAAGCLVGLTVWAGFQSPPPSLLASYSINLSVTPPKLKTSEPQKPITKTADHEAPQKVTLPLPGLSEDIPDLGAVPVIRTSDHLRPFDAYRRPFPEDQLSKPLVVLVMLDYGLSEQASGSILGVMPENLNVVLSPIARNAKDWSQKAYDNGFEIWMGLALQPETYPANDPGRDALFAGASAERNQRSVFKQMSNGVGYAGLFSPVGSPYLESGADADFLAIRAFERGLGLVIGSDTIHPTLKQEAVAQKAPYYAAPIISLDPVLTTEGMKSAFSRVEAVAAQKGFAIATFRPMPFARKAVLEWVTGLKNKGMVLAPLSVIAERGTALQP